MGDVQIEAVRKSYGHLEVVKGVDVSIEDGRFVVLVGPSGCGKSTLLRMIAGLEAISSGTISIDGLAVNDVPPDRRDVAMVFQSYALYPHMTVAENIGFSLKLKKAPRSEIAARVSQAARILDLEQLLDRYPRQLSGGQRQRVAMGRAIVREPKVFLFDEPLSNLDAKLRVQMRAEMKNLHGKLKTTTVYVTHDQVEAMTLADVIVVMHGGAVQQTGAPLDVYDRPANTFVAGFIGSPGMNMFHGAVVRGPDGAVFRTSDGVDLPLDRAEAGHDGRKLVYGVRPEHVSLVSEGGIKATSSIVEPTGSETLISLNAGSNVILAASRERTRIRPGENVLFRIDPSKVHLFDASDGLRIN